MRRLLVIIAVLIVIGTLAALVLVRPASTPRAEVWRHVTPEMSLDHRDAATSLSRVFLVLARNHAILHP